MAGTEGPDGARPTAPPASSRGQARRARGRCPAFPRVAALSGVATMVAMNATAMKRELMKNRGSNGDATAPSTSGGKGIAAAPRWRAARADHIVGRAQEGGKGHDQSWGGVGSH